MILGRKQFPKMKYVNFPRIHVPTACAKPETTIKAVKQDPHNSATNAVVPVIQQLRDNSITINGKTHQLLTTKEYLVKEYANVYQGIGLLPHLMGEKLQAS